jgi:hypothetical protein
VPLTIPGPTAPFWQVLLKMVLNMLERRRSSIAPPPGQHRKSLELPPRLLTLARKSQGRKPSGLGVLGLKQRTSSRALTQLAFPLMSQAHTIEEADEEGLLESPPPAGSGLLQRLSLTAMGNSGGSSSAGSAAAAQRRT